MMFFHGRCLGGNTRLLAIYSFRGERRYVYVVFVFVSVKKHQFSCHIVAVVAVQVHHEATRT